MQSASSNKLSKYICILCMVVMGCTSFLFYPRWTKPDTEATISYDVAGYYWYLPSLLIYHDAKHQAFKDSIMDHYKPLWDFQQAFQLPDGNYVMKYSSGMAVMYLPFFTAAHLLAGVLGYPRDGFSAPYQLAIQLGGVLMALLGLWYLRKLLLRFYSDVVVAITLLILVLTTNYLNCAAVDAGMSHGWLFTLYVFIILNTIHLHETWRMKYAVRLGLLIGLATLTRPTEAISCLIPLLWGMESISPVAIKNRFVLLLTKYKMFILAVFLAAAVVSIQLMYWKYASGHWIVYSYGNQKLYFRSPNFMDYTFDYTTGWLRYTPMMIFAFIGLIPFVRSGKNKVAITTFFLLNYYIICCWSVWSFGGRAMVQSYPILMFPMASLVQVALDKKLVLYVAAPFVLLFFYANIWITINSHYIGLYDITRMTKSYYWRVAGKWSAPPYVAFLKDETELFEGQPQNQKLLWQNDFEQDSTSRNSLPAIQGSRSLQLDSTTREAIIYKFPANNTKAQWLEADATFRCERMEYQTWSMSQFILSVYENGKIKKKNMIRVHRLLDDGVTKKIALYMDIRNQTFDSISVSLWNGYNNKRLLVDDVRVYSFDGDK